MWANASVYSSKSSQKATNNADLNSPVGQHGIYWSKSLSNHLSDFCWLDSSLPESHLLTDMSWWLVFSAPFCWLTFSWLLYSVYCPSLFHLVSWEISRASPLWEFRTKTDERILWLTPTPTETDAIHSVTSVVLFQAIHFNISTVFVYTQLNVRAD